MPDPFMELLRKKPWVGGVARGGLPVIPQSTALPTASADYEGQLTWVKGVSGTNASTVYICLMSSTGTYSWVAVAHG